MPRTHLWFGKNGTWKTRAAIQSALEGEKVALFELEPNGFRRAAGPDRAKFEESGNFRLHSYRVPSTVLDQLGELHLTEKGNMQVDQLVYKLEGWMDLLAALHIDFKKACADGYRPVIDTGTRLWLIERNAWEEQMQSMTQAQIDKAGQSKYTTPNNRILALMEYPDSYGLDTVMIAHEDTVYQSNPPIPKPDAQKEMENLVDVVLRFRMAGDIAVANVWKGAEAGKLKGMDIPEPTLGRVNQAIDGGLLLLAAGQPLSVEAAMDAEDYLKCQDAIRAAGMPMPPEVVTVLSIGRGLGVA